MRWFPGSAGLATESVASAALNTLRSASAFGAGALAARLLGPTDRGQVVFLASIASLIALAAAAGVTPALSRARAAAAGSNPVRATLTVTLARVAILAAVASVGSLVIAGVGPTGRLVPAGLLVLGLAAATALQAAASGLAGIAGQATRSAGAFAAGTATLLAGTGLLGLATRLDVSTLLVLWAATSAVSALAVVRPLRDLRPRLPSAAIFRWSSSAGWGELALSMAWRVDFVLVGATVDYRALARYSAVVAVAELSLGLIAGVRITLLRGVGLQGAGRRVAVHLVALVSAPAAVVAVVLGPWFIELTFGDAFGGLRPVLMTLLPGTIALGLSYVLLDQLTASGRTRTVTICGVAALAANVAGNIVLLPRFGISGAAMSSTVAYFVAVAIAWRGLRTATRTVEAS